MYERMEQLEGQLSTQRQQLAKQAKQLNEKKDRDEPKELQIKIAKIPIFDGGNNGTTIQAFITQARVNLSYYPSINTEEAKIQYVAGYLGGTAAEWFEPMLRDNVEHPKPTGDDETDIRDDDTIKIFKSFDYFAKRLKDTFGDPDEKRTAQRQLKQLRQKGAAAKYATEFQQLLSKTGWAEDDSMIALFYDGLKEEVKDKLSEDEHPENLSDFITKAIKIDSRIYERRLEKTGGKQAWQKPLGRKTYQQSNGGYNANQRRKREQRPTSYGYHSGPMDIDSAEKDNRPKCFNCGIPGHMARECRKPKQDRPWKGPVPSPKKVRFATPNDIPTKTANVFTKVKEEGKKEVKEEANWALQEFDWSQVHNSVVCYDEQCKECVRDDTTYEDDIVQINVASPEEEEHDALSWTVCYNDNCNTHRSDKEGAGWYPKKTLNNRKGKGPGRNWSPRPRKVRFAENPNDCRAGTKVAECDNLWCKTHVYAKAKEYHDIRDSTYRKEAHVYAQAEKEQGKNAELNAAMAFYPEPTPRGQQHEDQRRQGMLLEKQPLTQGSQQVNSKKTFQDFHDTWEQALNEEGPLGSEEDPFERAHRWEELAEFPKIVEEDEESFSMVETTIPPRNNVQDEEEDTETIQDHDQPKNDKRDL